MARSTRLCGRVVDFDRLVSCSRVSAASDSGASWRPLGRAPPIPWTEPLYHMYFRLTTLGLERGASWAEIRAANRRLAKKHHADKNPGDETSVWIVKEVVRAYEHLRGSHGVTGTTEEPRWRERDSGGSSDTAKGERKAKEKSERDHGVRGWWPSRLKPRFGVFAAFVGAVLVGVVTTMDDRRGDDQSDRSSRSVTEMASELVTAWRPDTGTARRIPVPAARRSSSLPFSVRAGTDVGQSRGGQLATEVVHKAETESPVRVSTPR